MKKNEATNEIDLLEIFLTLMNNKMKIVLIVVLSIAVASGFQYIQANKVTPKKFTTKISAVSMFNEDNNYRDIVLNVDFKKININRLTLFELFLKTLKIEIRTLIEQSNIIKKENYKDNKAYEVAINRVVSKVIIKEIIKDTIKGKQIIGDAMQVYGGYGYTEATIQFLSEDEDTTNKWLKILNTLEYSINKKTQEYLKSLINKKLERDKLVIQNQIEDIDRRIENDVKFYLLETDSRLSFLREQAKIAREGNVDSEKVTPSSFGSNYSINYNEDSLSLYYMKGYRVIEKEITLIKKRENPYLFAKNIPNLELRKLELESDQSIIRKEANFKKSAIFSDSKFSAGLINVNSTEVFQDEYTSPIIIIIISGLIGLIIGVFYVFISSAINSAMKRHLNND